jgi:hypothetical protein
MAMMAGAPSAFEGGEGEGSGSGAGTGAGGDSGIQ